MPPVRNHMYKPAPMTTPLNLDRSDHHEVRMVIIVPTFGRPEQDMKLAQSMKAILQTGLHSRVKVELLDSDDHKTIVEDRKWENIG